MKACEGPPPRPRSLRPEGCALIVLHSSFMSTFVQRLAISSRHRCSCLRWKLGLARVRFCSIFGSAGQLLPPMQVFFHLFICLLSR